MQTYSTDTLFIEPERETSDRMPTLVELAKMDTLCVCKSQSKSRNKSYIIGESKAMDMKLKNAQTTGNRVVANVYARKCYNADICADIINVVMKRNNISNDGLTSTNEYRHTFDVLDSAAVYIDTVASMTEHMTRKDFFAKLVENLTKEGETPNRTNTSYCETDHARPLQLTNGENVEGEDGSDLVGIRPLYESAASTSTMQSNTRATAQLIGDWLNLSIELTGNKNKDRVHFHDTRLNTMHAAFMQMHPFARCVPADLVPCIKTFINQHNGNGVVWKDSTKVKDVEGKQVTYNNVGCGVRLRMRDM